MQTNPRFTPATPRCRFLIIAGALAATGSLYAAILVDPNGTPDFGWALNLSDGNTVIGAPGLNIKPGTAYYYTNNSVLTLRKQTEQTNPTGSYFGFAASSSGSSALVGDFADPTQAKRLQAGAAYYYKNLDENRSSGDPSVTETVKLQASDATTNAYFGRAVSLDSDNALIGAFGDKYTETGKYVGAAYYFKSLNNATADVDGIVTETLKLTSDRAAGQNSHLGLSVSLSGDNALVSAAGVNQNQGEVYYYRNLSDAAIQAGSTVKETFVLSASDGAAGDLFGRIVSLEGGEALIGANGSENARGAAYYYKDLDSTAEGMIVNETVKLQASGGQAGDNFGYHASLSEGNALVGARGADSNKGVAYFFNDLHQAPAGSTVTETVMLTASDGGAEDAFGASVSLNGTRFAIGANRVNGALNGKVYTGDIRTFTVLDAGDTQLATEGLSFTTNEDWIIGSATSGNGVTVSRDSLTGTGDIANVSAADKQVYIGKQAGANNNELRIEGALITNQVFVGTTGSTGNVLSASAFASVNATSIHLSLLNSIGLEGLTLDYTDLFNWLNLQGDIALFANGYGVTMDNAEELLRISTSEGYTLYTAVPEPSTYAAALGVVLLGVALLRRRHKATIR